VILIEARFLAARDGGGRLPNRQESGSARRITIDLFSTGTERGRHPFAPQSIRTPWLPQCAMQSLAENSCLVLRFPPEICTDGERGINSVQPKWEATLRGGEVADVYRF
jgi:hypothetical protein